MKSLNLDAAPVAIVIANQKITSSFAKDTYQTAAHCPIAGKTLLEHILFELMTLQVKQTFIVAHDNASRLQQITQHGERWGMDMNTEVMQYDIDKQGIIDTFAVLSEPNGLLIIEADRLRSACLKSFIEQANKNQANLVEAIEQTGQRVGLTYLKKAEEKSTAWLMPLAQPITVNPLINAQQVLNANLDTVKGHFNGIKPAAKQTKGNWFKHYSAAVHTSTELEEAVMIGELCHIGKNSLLKNAVINDHVYVEPGAEISNSVIMPHTFISKNSTIHNAIVDKEAIYQL